MTFEELNPPYSTIVADPPWHYAKVNPDNPATGGLGVVPYIGSGLSYSTMTLDQIKALPVGDLAASDARLYLWVTNRYLRYAWDVIEAWGFTPQNRVFVWCKAPMGTMGVTTEFFLLGSRGSPPRLPWSGTTWFDWRRHRQSHSKKPDAFGDLVEAWSPGPYVELFARAPRLGWDSWGFGYE